MSIPLPPESPAASSSSWIRAHGMPVILVLFSVVGLGVGLRGMLLWEKSLPPSWYDLQGGLLDLGIGGIVALGVLVLRQQVARVLAWGMGVAWIGVNFASYEFVSTFDSLKSLGHATYVKDPTFFLGSFTQVAHPAVMALMVGCFSLGVWWPVRTKVVTLKSWAVALAGALVCLGAGLLVPKTQGVQPWRVGHFVPANLSGGEGEEEGGGRRRGRRWVGWP